jgi:hypothetical protein
LRPIDFPANHSPTTSLVVPISAAKTLSVSRSRSRIFSTWRINRAKLFRSASRLPGRRQKSECRFATRD